MNALDDGRSSWSTTQHIHTSFSLYVCFKEKKCFFVTECSVKQLVQIGLALRGIFYTYTYTYYIYVVLYYTTMDMKIWILCILAIFIRVTCIFLYWNWINHQYENDTTSTIRRLKHMCVYIVSKILSSIAVMKMSYHFILAECIENKEVENEMKSMTTRFSQSKHTTHHNITTKFTM